METRAIVPLAAAAFVATLYFAGGNIVSADPATKDEAVAQDTQASKPDETVWILQCESGSYRVRLIPDMAAKVEKIDQSKDKSE